MSNSGLFKDEKSFYEWLTDSKSGKSKDLRASIVGPKRLERERSRAAKEGKTNVEADPRLQFVNARVSNKHLCRWLNDRNLQDLAPHLDKEEIAGLFAPPPWGERDYLTPFERITGEGDDCLNDMAAWEPFRNVDMDKEKHMLNSSLKPSSKERKSCVSESLAALKAWQTVDRRSREALRRNFDSPIVKAFEDMILGFLNGSESEDIEDLTLEVENSYYRLLLHGICEYYGLVSNTVSEREDTVGGHSLVARTYIKKKKQSTSSLSVEPVPMRLVTFLSIIKNGLPNLRQQLRS